MNQKILCSNSMLVYNFKGFRGAQDKRVKIKVKKNKKNKK